MDQSTDGIRVAEAGQDGTGDDWAALGRALASEDPEAFAEAREIVRELVQRVRQREVRTVGVLGFRMPRSLA